MKKYIVCLLLGVLLAGCAAEPVFERVEDVYAGTEPVPAELVFMLPEEASLLVSQTDGTGKLYFCDGYTMTVQTLNGGDLDRSLKMLTGYGADGLTVLETVRDGVNCVTCAWTSAGEGGDQVGRLVLLDDGAFHYAVTVMADAERAGDLSDTWDLLLSRVMLSDTGA